MHFHRIKISVGPAPNKEQKGMANKEKSDGTIKINVDSNKLNINKNGSNKSTSESKLKRFFRLFSLDL